MFTWLEARMVSVLSRSRHTGPRDRVFDLLHAGHFPRTLRGQDAAPVYQLINGVIQALDSMGTQLNDISEVIHRVRLLSYLHGVPREYDTDGTITPGPPPCRTTRRPRSSQTAQRVVAFRRM